MKVWQGMLLFVLWLYSLVGFLVWTVGTPKPLYAASIATAAVGFIVLMPSWVFFGRTP